MRYYAERRNDKKVGRVSDSVTRHFGYIAPALRRHCHYVKDLYFRFNKIEHWLLSSSLVTQVSEALASRMIGS